MAWSGHKSNAWVDELRLHGYDACVIWYLDLDVFHDL